MEVILKEDVAKLGNRGEVVKVAEGYGRNFLLPRKLAIQATVGQQDCYRADEGCVGAPLGQGKIGSRSAVETV